MPQDRGRVVYVPHLQKALPIPLWNHLRTVLLGITFFFEEDFHPGKWASNRVKSKTTGSWTRPLPPSVARSGGPVKGTVIWGQGGGCKNWVTASSVVLGAIKPTSSTVPKRSLVLVLGWPFAYQPGPAGPPVE
jgi:hypothetical protein